MTGVKLYQSVWLLTFAAAATLLFLQRETLASLVDAWLRSETYSHGFLIAPISASLIVTRRTLLRSVPPRVEVTGLVLTAALTLCWMTARLTAVLVLEQLAMVGLLLTLIWTVLGTRAFAILAFPMGFLIFAVPFGDFLIPALMEWTATMTVAGLQAVAIPVFREGMYFSIPSGDFEVAKACSGIRYLIASLTVGVLFAYLNYRLWWKRMLFVALALIIPIVANWLRAFGIVMIAHLSDLRWAVDVDHLIYGWLFFGVVMFLLFAVGHTFRDSVAADAPPPRPTNRLSDESSPSLLTFAAASVFCLATVTAGQFYTNQITREWRTLSPPKINVPPARAGWSLDQGVRAWQPAFRRSDSQLHAGYRLGARRVELHLFADGATTHGQDLTSADNRLSDGQRWLVLDSTKYAPEIDLPDMLVVETKLMSRNDNLLVWHWFDINGKLASGRFMAKLHQASQLLSGSNGYSAFIALATPIDTTREAARSTLTDFLQLHAAVIAACIEISPSDSDAHAPGYMK